MLDIAEQFIDTVVIFKVMSKNLSKKKKHG